jgi:hypothetical protein
MTAPLARSRALWNRESLDLASDEILAQLLDRGSLEDWRELYALASRDETLRGRIARLLHRAPIGYPGFWLAALASLGEGVDWTAPLPEDPGI